MANLEPPTVNPNGSAATTSAPNSSCSAWSARARDRSPDPLADLGADRVGVATAVLHMLSGGDPDRPEQLRAFLTSELTAVLEESKRLHAEVERLRLLRQPGVEPDGGAPRSA